MLIFQGVIFNCHPLFQTLQVSIFSLKKIRTISEFSWLACRDIRRTPADSTWNTWGYHGTGHKACKNINSLATQSIFMCESPTKPSKNLKTSIIRIITWIFWTTTKKTDLNLVAKKGIGITMFSTKLFLGVQFQSVHAHEKWDEENGGYWDVHGT